MVHYNSFILKRAQNKLIPENTLLHFDNAFQAIERTGDLSLFDIKRLREAEDKKRVYYRLRKENTGQFSTWKTERYLL
jgi:hypothetical protein